MAEQQNYIIKLKGRNLDGNQIRQIKHPLQAILHKGIAPTVHLEITGPQELTVHHYKGPRETLEKQVGKALAKVGLYHHSLAVDFEIGQRVEQQKSVIIDEDVQTLKDENVTLDSLLEERFDAEILLREELEKLQRDNEVVKNEYKTELENLRKANKGISESKRQAEATARELGKRYEKLDVDYKKLSEIFEDISASARGVGPIDMFLEKIRSSSYVSKFSEDLEKLLADSGSSEIESTLMVGSRPFFEYVNIQRLGAIKFNSDDEVIKAMSVAGPFAETEYAKANSAKYVVAIKALELVQNIDALELLGMVVDRTKMLENVAELKKFKEEYEFNQKTHNENLNVSGKVQDMKAIHDKAKSLVDYMSRVCGESRYIPCLITANLAYDLVEVTFPQAGNYFVSQFENTLNKALEGTTATDNHKSEKNNTAFYGMKFKDMNPIVAHADLAHRLYQAQESADFYKLGFKLRIYTFATIDDMQHVHLPPFPQEAEETEVVLDLTKK
jgi:hypothetical protein